MVNAINYWYQKWLSEKKKVAELEEQVKTAEDHAYFAGSEAMRVKLIDKACVAYCKDCGHYAHKPPTHICRQDCDYYERFRKTLMEE